MTGKALMALTLILASCLCFAVAPVISTAGTGIQSTASTSTSSSEIVGFLDYPKEAVPGEVIIGFKDTIKSHADQEAIINRYGGKLLKRDTVLNHVLVGVDRLQEQDFIAMIKQETSVKYAEPNYIVKALYPYTPNDPRYGQQWGPKAIKADRAWDIQRGNHSIKIAIVDTGIDYTHEDLAGNYVHGGYDWINDDSDPMDDHGHGTHCAGIAAAVLNNHKGIAGIANVSIMAEKVLNETGFGDVWNVSEGIEHAADQGAAVISLSLGSESPSQTLKEACEYAWDSGCLIVAAAGNDNAPVVYPAAYDTVIAVGALENETERVWWSNHGPELELMAPGVNILSTYPGNSYAYGSGTSMATPHVAGVAALVWSSANCPDFTNQKVREYLNTTADDLGEPGWDSYYGWGRVDAEEAIKVPSPFSQNMTAGWNLFSLPVIPGDNATGTVLSSLSGEYDAVYRYKTVWDGFLSPDTMDPGMGYLLHLSSTATWDCTGISYHSMRVNLSEGLNMVGWLRCSKPVTNALSSIHGNYHYVARWNASSQRYESYNPGAPAPFNDFDTMESGEGYWIAAKHDCTLTETCS